MTRVSILLGVTLAAAMAALPDVALSEPSASITQSQFRELRGDARQVRSASLYLERLIAKPGTTWQQVDEQWNVLKPEQDSMVDRVNLLATVQNSMTPAEVQAYKIAKSNVAKIAADMNQFYNVLNQQGVDVQSPKIQTIARQMASDARAVALSADGNVSEAASR